jgi:hypothetical protein
MESSSSEHENHRPSRRDASQDDQLPGNSRKVPQDFVVRSKPASNAQASGAEFHRGAALGERSYDSLQRIARYMRLDGVSNCSRAELLARIRAELFE